MIEICQAGIEAGFREQTQANEVEDSIVLKMMYDDS